MTTLVWIAAALVGLSALMSGRRAERAPWALGVLAATNTALELGHVRLEANHPLRLVGAVVVMAIAYTEMLSEGKWSRAYVIAWLTFALGGSATMAPIAYVFWGQWALPAVVIVFCTAICAVSVLPERSLSWLRSLC